MTRSPVFTGLIFLIFVGALAIRLARLHERPMHVDEAVQAVKTGTLYDTGVYRYDPHEHHGPTLYYFAALSMKLAGCKDFPASSEIHYRVIPVIFGSALILLLLLLGDALGKPAAICAGVLTAISPAMVFYSRYYIQEMLLVFFTLAALAALWRYFQEPSLKWAALSGAALGFMHATKETCVIAYAAIAAGLLLTLSWNRSREKLVDLKSYVQPKHLAVLVGSAAIVSIFWFSSFFTNAQGPLDSIRTYGNYLHRAGGEGSSGVHDHPWHYYLMTLLYSKEGRGPVFTEALIVILAIAGFIAGLSRKGIESGHAGFIQALGFFTLAMTAAYSIIPYKTPWCLLSFLSGMILLAGVGAVALVNVLRPLPMKAVAVAVLAAASAHLGWQTYQTSFKYYDDPRNPYVYAHTVSDIFRLNKRIEEIAAVSPDKSNMLIKVCCPDYWPLPWYLRRYPRVGYWNAPPADADAPIVVASPETEGVLDATLKREYQKEFYGLRPKVFLKLYIEKELWDTYMRKRSETKPNP